MLWIYYFIHEESARKWVTGITHKAREPSGGAITTRHVGQQTRRQSIQMGYKSLSK
nr:MAG TPA: hypothetical protein [Caudoviricetes sp.]